MMDFLNTEDDVTDDVCYGCYDIQTWHEILKYDDVSKLDKVTEGMTIKGKVEKSNLNCEILKTRKICSE